MNQSRASPAAASRYPAAVSYMFGEPRPGVSFLSSLSGADVEALTARAEAARQDGDLVAVSIHWGANWGYEVTPDQARFARRLIDGGISLVYGHSCHHPCPVEVYGGRLILYGCGDCIDDYEGISGHMRSSGTTCGCCTSRPWHRAPARCRSCGWCRCDHGRCGCGTPAPPTARG